ncbi:MAG: hypothetical protein CVT92_10575 [Bacteroidetes bacterium HGW-Bacteroidetes-1]|jgi:hypothetical protein|nr:MAG: hypothetical protein CVT92_10575 [Bacteroidetes bacterium HGW-Bacteroidetes-1]
MKKIYILLSLLLLFSGLTSIEAQNIVINPGMENWTSDTQPVGWTVVENISQESTITHSGSFSAKHTSASSTKKIQQVIEGIEPGASYTIQYYFFDNDNAAKMRIWSYWLNGASTLPDDEAILRPATYSENSGQWQEFSAVITAPATATGFRFELRAYNQDGANGGSVYYDDFVLSTDVVLKPEPTNYPTAFDAVPQGRGALLSWTDAVGEQLPDGYLIYGEIVGIPEKSRFLPEDGTPVANNLDISLGYISWNVELGEESHLFSFLDPNEGIYGFSIFPYTNAGEGINYKIDGTVPQAAVLPNTTVLLLEETFDADLGVMSAYSVTGEQTWQYYNFNNEDFARISGYSGGNFANEDWLISPSLNWIPQVAEITLNFRSARNYAGNDLQLMISSNYDGTGNPNNFTWAEITDQAEWSAGSWAWAFSGDVLMAETVTPPLYIAFKYTSTTEASSTYQVDDIVVYGISYVGLNENETTNVKVYPNPANDFINLETQTSANIVLTDLAGRVILQKQISAGQHQLNIQGVSSGLYIMAAIEENGKKSIVKIAVR